MSRLTINYYESNDINHKDRFDSNMEEDIKREYIDILRQREYIKNAILKRAEDLYFKCLDITNMLDKRIRDTRLKIEGTQVQLMKIVTSFWRNPVQQKYQSDNTNKIIVSQDFGGNKYSQNSRIMYIINDKL